MAFQSGKITHRRSHECMTTFMWWIVAVLLVSTICVGSGSADIHQPDAVPTQCIQLLDEMSRALQDFDGCSIVHSRPFTMCLNCASYYDRAHRLFDGLINGHSERSKNCSMLINGGKVSIIVESFNQMEKIWKVDGSCQECYKPGSYDVSENIREFFSLKRLFLGCVDSSPNNTCQLCRSSFNKLSAFFSEVLNVETHTRHDVCLDVLDAMNTTRHKWAHLCYTPPHGLTLDVAVLMGIVAGATIFFYCLVGIAQRPQDTELVRVSTLQTLILEEDCSMLTRAMAEAQEDDTSVNLPGSPDSTLSVVIKK